MKVPTTFEILTTFRNFVLKSLQLPLIVTENLEMLSVAGKFYLLHQRLLFAVGLQVSKCLNNKLYVLYILPRFWL